MQNCCNDLSLYIFVIVYGIILRLPQHPLLLLKAAVQELLLLSFKSQHCVWCDVTFGGSHKVTLHLSRNFLKLCGFIINFPAISGVTRWYFQFIRKWYHGTYSTVTLPSLMCPVPQIPGSSRHGLATLEYLDGVMATPVMTYLAPVFSPDKP